LRYSRQTYQITIERYTTTRDASGGVIETWATYSQPYASIKYQSGSERLDDKREQTQVRAIFKVQYDSDTNAITEGDRISFRGNWDIQSILVMGRDETIEITAVKHG